MRQLASGILGNTRIVQIYTPPAFHTSGNPYPVLLLFDGDVYAGAMATPTALDNLIAAGRIPPVVAVMLRDVQALRSRELGGDPAFVEFLHSELMPWVRKEYNVTADPRQTIVGGQSMGGFAASYAALLHPETFGNVISQSGSLWWTPPFARGKDGNIDHTVDQSWIVQQFLKSPVLPVRFYFEAGNMELDLSGLGGSTLLPAMRMRDVLLARGYSVIWNEFYGHHDDVVWRETLAEALVRLFGQPR